MCRRLADFRLDREDGAVEGLVRGKGLVLNPLGDVDERPGDLLLLSLPNRSNSLSGTWIFRIPLKL